MALGKQNASEPLHKKHPLAFKPSAKIFRYGAIASV